MARRAKLVCTLGPATADYPSVLGLVRAGMDVARLNMSHGDHEAHRRSYEMVRRASDETGHAVGVLADLQGPKVRLGRFAGGPVTWEPGDRVVLTGREVEGTAGLVSCTYTGLAGDVAPGMRLLVADGAVALRVVAVEGLDVVTEVVDGGVVSDGKGVNLPGVPVSLPALTEDDEADLRFALTLRVDLVALSFVRRAADVEPVRKILAECDAADLPVLAKLEKPEAVDHLREVVEAFDGVMVARGDLGVEMAVEQVPLVQKRAVQIARELARPVIVATQVLESMITNPRPTRAEVSDAANAVLDGADALMLSGETAVGRHTAEAVRVLDRVCATTEEHGLERVPGLAEPPRTRGGAIASAAVEVAENLPGVLGIVVFTQTGSTMRRVARMRPRVPMLAFTPEPAVRSRLALTWGVETFLAPVVDTTDEMVRVVERQLLDLGRARRGDTVVIIAGFPVGRPGYTNAMRVHRLGDLVGR